MTDNYENTMVLCNLVMGSFSIKQQDVSQVADSGCCVSGLAAVPVFLEWPGPGQGVGKLGPYHG